MSDLSQALSLPDDEALPEDAPAPGAGDPIQDVTGHRPASVADGTPANSPTADPGTPARRDLVGGLEKGLLVIEAFDQERPRLSIAEVAQRTGLTRAAARRYLLTLAHLGYVSQDRRLFSLAPRVLRLGQSYMHSARLPRILQPHLHKMAYALQEASSAGVLDRDDVLCLAATSAGRVVSATLQPGTRVPAYCTANGRVLLAALAPDVLDGWLSRQSLEALTPRTITHAERLRLAIARVRADGYALVDQEFELGLRTISVPLRNFRGETVAAMNISAHASRMEMSDLLDRCLPVLQQAQAQLRTLL